MPTKACYTGHGCFPLNRWYCLYIEHDVISKDLHSSGMLLWVFSSQETFLCSDLSPGVLFVIKFPLERKHLSCKLRCWRSIWECAICPVPALLPEHLWTQSEAGSWPRWVHVYPGNAVLFYSHHFATPSLCWEVDWGHTLASSLTWAWHHLQAGCREGNDQFGYWSLAASLSSNSAGEASLS